MKTMLRVFLVIDDYNELLYLQTVLRKLGFDTEGLQNTKKYEDVSLGFNPHVLITTARGRKVNGLELIKTVSRNRGLPKIITLKSTDDTISAQEVEELKIDLVLESPTNAKKLIMALASVSDLDVNALIEKYNRMKANAEVEGEVDDFMVASYDETGKEIDAKPRLFSLAEDREIGHTSEDQPHFPLRKESIEGDPGIDSVDLNLDGQNDNPFAEVASLVEKEPIVGEEDAQARKKRYEEFIATADKPEPGRFDRDRILQFNKRIRSAQKVEGIEEIERDRKEFVRSLYEKPSDKN